MHSAQENAELAALSPWMNAAFALDELHSDPQFGELKALVDELQRRKVLASDRPDNETLSAFLDEMEQLDVEIAMSIEELEMSMICQTPEPVATAPPPCTRKKKISSTERRKREKALLLDSIDQLQLQLEGAIVEKQQQLLPTDWRHRAQEEWCDREHMVHENLQIRRALALEQSYAGTVALLLHQLNASMENLTYSEACAGRQDDVVMDAAIFEMLASNIDENYAQLVQEWRQGSIPMAAAECVDATVSPDGNVMTYKFARIVPFDVMTVMDTAWRSGQSDFHEGMSRTVFQHGPDMFCAKEELTIHPAGQSDVTLCVRVAIKRFVCDSMAVFLWETVGDWSTLTDAESTTTQESGWVLIRPVVESSSPISVVQSFVKMTLSETSKVWMQLMHSSGVMLSVILPSYRHIMVDRIQRFENRLMDEAMQKAAATANSYID